MTERLPLTPPPEAPGADAASRRIGVLCGLGGLMIWGLFPIPLNALREIGVGPFEVVAHRALWAAVLLGAFCLATGRMRRVREAAADRRNLGLMLLAAALIGVNWLGFVYAVQTGRASESAMGYYIYPLMAVAAGAALFRESVTLGQWLALALAAAGIGYMVAIAGAPPWIGVFLAASFTFYGITRKLASVGPIIGVFWECVFLSAPALAYLWFIGGGTVLNGGWDTALILSLGPITAVSLVLFVEATKRLPYSTLGVVTYINPTMQLMCGVLLFEEVIGERLIGFVLIWLGVALYCRELLRKR